MRVNEKDMEILAHCSKIELSAKEQAAYLNSLNVILEHMDVLNSLDTAAVEPALHVRPQKNVFRADKAEGGLEKELALANAPQQEQGSFKVPRII